MRKFDKSPNKKQVELSEIIENNNQITFAYCKENDSIIEIASMCNYKVIFESKGWIEDHRVPAINLYKKHEFQEKASRIFSFK